MPKSTIALLPILVIIVATVSAADAPRSAFDRVAVGPIVVYAIDDLTGGQQQNADAVTTLVRDTIDPNAWKGEWRAAALRATPHCLTVKANSTIQREVAGLLRQVREQRNLFVRVDYQLISASADAEHLADGVISNALQHPAIKAGIRIVGPSEATIANGSEATLVDGTDLSLPTIAVTAVVGADRRAVTLNVSVKDPVTLQNTSKPIVFAMGLNDSAGVSIPTGSGTAWLVVQPQLVERHWTPLGTAQMIDRE